MRRSLSLTSAGLLCLVVVAPSSPAVVHAMSRETEARQHLSGLRLPFIANEGQVDARVAYYAQTFAGTLFVTGRGELVYALPPLAPPRTKTPLASAASSWTLTETLRGGKVKPVGQDRSATGVSYFLGNDPRRWHPHVPTYEQISLGEVWPGVTVSLRAQGRSIEKVFTVHPGASVERIRVRVGGAEALSVDSQGALVARTGLGPVTFTAPVAYQERDGLRRAVTVAYRQVGREYGFTVKAYDRSLPLVIDPLLQSTYLGGTNFDQAHAVAIAPTSGDVYVAGYTGSTDFPGTSGGAQLTYSALPDAFVARLSRSLTMLIQATYLGGNGQDEARAVVIAPTSGDVYVVGRTTSSNFPGTSGGAQSTYGGNTDAFVARLSSSLTMLTQATYLGGNAFDQAHAVAIAPTSGDIYVAGATLSTNFPGTSGGAQSTYGGGNTDAFVARLSSSLTTLTQATYLGGTGSDEAYALAIAPTSGDVYVAGETLSTNFPGTSGGAQPTSGGVPDAFVARLSSNLQALTQATYLGGSSIDVAFAIAIDSTTGNVYVAGGTASTDFPGTSGGAQPASGGGTDAFVARLKTSLTALTQATYLGGASLGDEAKAIAIHPTTGHVYVTGETDATNFPGTSGGAQATFGGGSSDAFVARLTSSLTALVQATYLGGSGLDQAHALAIAPTTGDVYVAGYTTSTNFPGTSGGAQPAWAGSDDAFVARLTYSLRLVDPGCCEDFNGDGKADLLWRNTGSGTVAIWLMDGGTVLSNLGLGAVDTSWVIAQVGDFNGDGKADFLWRNTTSGAVVIWLMNGGAVMSNFGLGTVPTSSVIEQVGDFNGDGKSDILWRDTASGVVFMWLMDGGTITSNLGLGAVTLDWTIAKVGDFNGDGKADILWRNTTSGAVNIWFMNAGTVTSTAGLGAVGLDWLIAKAADFDGDGKADILWRNTTSGAVAIWFMNAGTITSISGLGAVTLDWTIDKAGDYNGDAKADILWRNTTSGAVAIWFMNGGTVASTASLGTVPTSWQTQ